MPSHDVQFRTRQNNPEHPGVEDIEPKELWEMKAHVVIVDVRRPDEFGGELGHVPGSQLMVLDTLPMRLSELPTDKVVVFTCRSGNRSGRAAAFAKENGYTKIFNMKGGMLLWNELNLPVEREE